jgi:hypothetical protein
LAAASLRFFFLFLVPLGERERLLVPVGIGAGLGRRGDSQGRREEALPVAFEAGVCAAALRGGVHFGVGARQGVEEALPHDRGLGEAFCQFGAKLGGQSAELVGGRAIWCREELADEGLQVHERVDGEPGKGRSLVGSSVVARSRRATLKRFGELVQELLSLLLSRSDPVAGLLEAFGLGLHQGLGSSAHMAGQEDVRRRRRLGG